MSADPTQSVPPTRQQGGDGGGYAVDARGAMGVQVGEGSTQIIYSYNRLTWTDGVAPPPLVSVSGVIASPYRGLGAFEERDAAFFFGREAAATKVLQRMIRCLEEPGLLVVSGVSGAGKSSLLRAGVLPRIRGAGLASAPGSASWPCLVFTPGHAPLDELAVRVAALAGTDAGMVRRGLTADPADFALTAQQAALAQPAGPPGRPGEPAERARQRLLLVVDQFEQLFTQCPDEAQRQAFIVALHAAATAGHGPDLMPAAVVVLGVRADFEARCAGYPQLADAVQDRYLVTSMTERQLRMAITEPAKKAGSRVDDDLVEVLLREIRTSQSATSGGVLPLLSHALDQAWRSRTGNDLTVDDYERTGGIEGAVADSAQRAYDHLTPVQQAVARQVFIRLTATSSDGVDTADRAARAELAAGMTAAAVRDVEAVLEAFAAERLLTLAADTVEISHEILLSAWPLLHDTWLAESHADRIVRTRLHNVATEWTRHDRDPSYLYSGSLLATATEAAARIDAAPARHPPLSDTERDFLRASDRAHRRRVNRRRGLIAFLTAMVIGLASVAALALLARQDAVHAGQEAIRQRDAAVSEQLATESEALGDTSPVVSKLLSIAAWRINPSDDARYAMLAAAARPGNAVLTDPAGPVKVVAFSLDGKTIASSGDGTIRLWDMTTRQQIGNPLPDSGVVDSLAFSPDGKTVASGEGGATQSGTVRLWDVATHRQIGDDLVIDSEQPVDSVAFSPDGKTLAGGVEDGTVRLWDVATRQQIGNPLTAHAKAVLSVAFSPDGKTLASGADDGTVRLWDVATHRQIGNPLTGNTKNVGSLAFSPDGKTLAVGSNDGTVRLWDVATRQQIGNPLTGNTKNVGSLALSPDGKTLAVGSNDGTVRLWNVATRQQIGDPLTGHVGPVWSVAFSPDGKTLATGGADHTIRLWNVATRQVGSPLLSHTTVGPVAFSPDGKTLASGNDDSKVQLWDVATHRQIWNAQAAQTAQTAQPLDGVNSVAFSPDGKILASGAYDGTVRLWDVATHRQIWNAHPTGPDAIGVDSVAFSPDGKILASGNDDSTVRLWNVTTHHQIWNAQAAKSLGGVNSVAFSPDGKILASGNNDGTVRLWNVGSRKQSALTGGFAIESVAFSPDGKTLASGDLDGTVRLWNVATHRQIGESLGGQSGAVWWVAFSPDGKILASGADDGTVRLWDVATRQQIGNPLTGSTTAVDSVAFSPDGKILASGDFDGTVRLWDVTYLTNPVTYLCASARRSLTRAEWAQYVSGPAYQNVCP